MQRRRNGGERERESNLAKIAEQKERVKSIRLELDSAEQQIALLNKKLDAAHAVGEFGRVAIDATVVAVRDGHVELSVGDDGGILNGLRLIVFRDETRLGEVEIVENRGEPLPGSDLKRNEESGDSTR